MDTVPLSQIGRGRSPVPRSWADAASYLIQTDAQPIEAGNINLYTRPQVRNRDGSVSTVHSMSYNDGNGEVLIPTISDLGRHMAARTAIDYWRKRGAHLGRFSTPAEADAYAQALHEQQAAFYGLR